MHINNPIKGSLNVFCFFLDLHARFLLATVTETYNCMLEIRILANGYAISCVALSVNAMHTPFYKLGKPPKPVGIEDILELATNVPEVLMTPVDGNPEFVHVSIPALMLVSFNENHHNN